MRYRVVVTEPAIEDAQEYSAFIRKRSQDEQAADQWWNGLIDAIFSLEDLPGRCPLIPERIKVGSSIHHLLYFSHRIIFRLEPGRVTVLRIYHSAQRPLTRTSIDKAL